MKKFFLALVIASLLAFAGISLAIAKPVSLQSQHFLVFSEASSDGQEVLKIADETYPEITVQLGFEPKGRLKIYVFRHYSSFIQKSGYKGKGKIAGLARPDRSEIFICSTLGNPRTTTVHEISHVVFLQSVPNTSRIPFWFIEGLAIYQSDPNLSAADLEELALEGDLPTITTLSERKPFDSSEGGRTAAQGYLAVRFIADKYGQNKLYDLVGRLQTGQNFETSLEQATGANKVELERLWRGYMEEAWIRTLWSTLRYFGWTLLPVLVILAVATWFIRRKKKLERLDEDEVS